MLGILAGADTRELAARGDLVIRGDQASAAMLMTTIAGPGILAPLIAHLTTR
jgi:hypothetical protein